VQITAGPVGLDVPRDRNGTFEPVTVLPTKIVCREHRREGPV
jgi:hypothetical protein